MGGGGGQVMSTQGAALAWLPPVNWDGLDLDPGENGDGSVTVVVESVDGWYDSPPLDGGDLDRALSDGAAFGPKVRGARVIAITGVVIADDPADLRAMRDELSARAVALNPADLTIGDADGQVLTASVRADTDGFKHTFIAPNAFRWTVSLTAGDPRLYDAAWSSVTMSNLTGHEGWTYNPAAAYTRTYPRVYGSPTLPSTAQLDNAGNVAAPVMALFTGPLSAGLRLTDGTSSILMAALNTGEQIWVDTEKLAAVAPGGANRASYILSGSQPLTVPPGGATWSLFGSGAGTVALYWRGAWA